MRIKGLGERGILLLLVSFFVGRMNVLEIQPFAVGFFMAVCYEGQLPKGWYLLSLLLGIGSIYGTVEVVKYGIILILSMWIVYFLEKKSWKPSLPFYGMIGGSMILLVEGFWRGQSVLYSMDIIMILLEGLLAVVFCHILYVGIHGLLIRKSAAYIKNEELISGIVLGCIVIYGIPFWENEEFVLLSMLLSFLVLFFGYKYGAGAGSLAGAIAGVFLLPKEEGFATLGILSLLGIGAGMFRELGKFVSGTTFLLLYIVLGKYFDVTLWDTGKVRAVVAAIVVFWLLPGKWITPIDLNLGREEEEDIEQMQKQIKRRLSQASEPFFRLSKAFMELAGKRIQVEEGDMEQVLNEVTDSLCIYCEKSNRCLGYTRHEKYNTANCLLQPARERGIIQIEDLPVHFANKCDYLDSYIQETNQALRMVHIRLEWQNRLAESREAIAEQFRDVGQLLRDFQGDTAKEDIMSLEQKKEIIAVLKRNQILVKKIEKIKKNNGFREVHLVAKGKKGICVTTKELSNCISALLEQNFVPSMECHHVLGGEYEKIVLLEDTQFHAITGLARVNKEGEDISGDNFSFVRLDSGVMVMSLADGMGSGESACQESTWVIELLETFLEAGVAEKTTIRFINSILVLESEEQHFSTLDMAMINLYTGVCEFIKMGAATAFIKRDNWVETISSSTLPMGVFNQVEYEDISKKLYHGDYIILLSDGVLDAAPCVEKEQFFQGFILSQKCQNPNELAQNILDFAKSQCEQDAFDDMTVLVTGIWKK